MRSKTSTGTHGCTGGSEPRQEEANTRLPKDVVLEVVLLGSTRGLGGVPYQSPRTGESIGCSGCLVAYWGLTQGTEYPTVAVGESRTWGLGSL